MEESPKYITKRGQPSLKDVTGEDTKDFRFKMPESLHTYLMQAASEEDLSAAEFLRRLIAAHQAQSTDSR